MKTNVAFKANDLTDAQVRDMLAAALKDKVKAAAGAGSYASCYVVDVNRAKGFLTYQDYGDYDGGSALYRCSFEIGDDYAVTLGEAQEVVATTKYAPVPASFALAAAEAVYDGDLRVYPNSLLFRSGDYPDKQFGMTPAEIIAAISAFEGSASVNLEHAPTMLVGKLGVVRKLFTDDEGQTLRGEVALPKWLDDQLTDAERQVSSEFDRGTKQFRGLALTPTPRIEGAALMAAFTAAKPPVKASPKPGTKGSRMNKLKELLAGVAAMFTQAVVDIENDDQTDDKTKTPVPAPRMEHAPVPATTIKVTPVAFDNAANEARFAAQAAELATLRADKIRMGAEKFADGEIAEFRALPRERTGLIAQFVLAAQDDHDHPGAVSFSSADGKAATGTRVDALRASQAMRPRHSYTREVLSGDPEATLYFAASDDKADDSDDEEVQKNLKKTALGKKAMAAKKEDK